MAKDVKKKVVKDSKLSPKKSKKAVKQVTLSKTAKKVESKSAGKKDTKKAASKKSVKKLGENKKKAITKSASKASAKKDAEKVATKPSAKKNKKKSDTKKSAKKSAKKLVKPITVSTKTTKVKNNPVQKSTQKSIPVRSLPEEIELIITAHAGGILQTDIYLSVGEAQKNRTMKLLAQLAKEGKIRRERNGRTFLIFKI